MKIENPKYIYDLDGVTKISISAIVDGLISTIPLSEKNRHYAEILRQVEEGTLTIKDAD